MRVKQSGVYEKFKKNKWKEMAMCDCGCSFKVRLKDIVDAEHTEMLSECGFTATLKPMVLLKALCPECKEETYVAAVETKVFQKLANEIGTNQQERGNDEEKVNGANESRANDANDMQKKQKETDANDH